jgi:hypothetical protein
VAASQRWLDGLAQVVAPGGEDQQRFGQGIHRLVQHQFAQRFGQRRATRLAGAQDRVAARPQPGLRGVEVRGLAGAVDALGGDEAAG